MLIEVVVVLGAVAGAALGGRGVVLLAAGLRGADHSGSALQVIRGIRGIAVAIGTGAIAAGVLLEATWALVFGAVFLLEELYETGVVALVLRAGRAE